ncbi:sugar ABC transporter permease [Ideonella sp. 4Y16]|uniref:Xylose transport system permease protein XylH n=1 Tax=Ideonella alba TaxID=2824118 RepID=A0A940Y5Y3_9BURK|nr:multiple monosaccharide ABC transporter permease [Ideonella alba]MBQ0928900.1 sugar ABC transporter permease [Ideonella alba]MBQ0942835.1 sugar ABC transporter permease [Ideonella alba]
MNTTSMAPAAPPAPALLARLREHGLVLALVAITGLFQWLTDGTLLQPLNLTNLVLQNSFIVVMALGMLLVIVAGHIDLSVGSVCGFTGALAAVLMVQHDWPVLPAVAACLAAGALIGALQGWFVAYLAIPSFIVTLGGMLVFKGLALALLQGQSLGPFPDGFQALSTGFLPDLGADDEAPHASTLGLAVLLAVAAVLLPWRRRAQRLRHGMAVEPLATLLPRQAGLLAAVLGGGWLMASYKGAPLVLLLLLVLVAVYELLASRSVLGRQLYALGGNAKAARLSGIRTERLAFAAFVNMGVLAALAGLVFAARLNSATPKAGLGFELDVIAACFIGGASASGGVGRIGGAVIGAFVMGVMNNGMSILGIGIDYQQVIKGVVLLAAVCVDARNRHGA